MNPPAPPRMPPAPPEMPPEIPTEISPEIPPGDDSVRGHARMAQRLQGVCRRFRLFAFAITILSLAAAAGTPGVVAVAPERPAMETAPPRSMPGSGALYTLAALAAIVAATACPPRAGAPGGGQPGGGQPSAGASGAGAHGAVAPDTPPCGPMHVAALPHFVAMRVAAMQFTAEAMRSGLGSWSCRNHTSRPSCCWR